MDNFCRYADGKKLDRNNEIVRFPNIGWYEVGERRPFFHSVRQMSAGRVPVQTSAHATPAIHTPKDLAVCPYVFVRTDRVVNPLASKYTGPYKVLERSERAFKLDYGTDTNGNDLQDWVTLERLKPAYLDPGTYDEQPAPPRQGPGRPRRAPPAPPPERRPRGRPKGSKNKK